MRKDHDWLYKQIKHVREKVDNRINKLKIKLRLVKDRKKDLARAELKLRSMRAIATKIRDEDLDDREKNQLINRFNKLQNEVDIKI